MKLITSLEELYTPLPPIKVGTQVTVGSYDNIDIRVYKVEYIADEVRFKIHLEWDGHGVSHVYPADEGKSWKRIGNSYVEGLN
jgi:hypothetical protein